jgi:glycosyltransferase involved in cell wall biosynthesis
VIVTEDTGMKEIVGDAGFVVPTGDADAILERLVALRERRPMLARRAS